MSRFRPRLESLEGRIQPGDTLLGLWTVAQTGLSCVPVDSLLAPQPGGSDEQPQDLNWPPAHSLAYTAWWLNSPREETYHPTGAGPAVGHPGTEFVAVFEIPSSVSDNALAGAVAVSGLAGTAPSQQTPLLGLAVIGSAVDATSQGSAAFAPPALALNRESAPALVGLLAAAGSGSFGSPSVHLSFDGPTAQLGIRTDAGQHTISESTAPDGFLNLTIDGQGHSSNPRLAAFDTALSGATGATLAGISFQGGGHDTLILASQQHAGGFTVQATGATVVAQNVTTSGPLAIQAPNITVSGAVQGSSVSLVASGWITVATGGRIEASAGRAGGVNPRSGITVAAGLVVNSGQLHADCPSGGQVRIQAANILNAGPITADATNPNGHGGEVQIAFTGAYEATTGAVASASSTAGTGGRVIIGGGSTGHLFSSGRYLATGFVGGAVDLFARDVVLAGATVDASGAGGGGTVHIGESNADGVTVTPASTVRADALRAGTGGQVSVWANRSTAFDGAISARGGSSGGAGGLIEVSGQGDLSYGGSADAGGSSGKSGTLVLDPKNLTISDAPAGVFPQFDLIDPHPTAAGGFGTVVSVLNNGNVVVTNPKDDFGGMNAGAVYLFDGVSGALISSLVGSNPNDQLGYYGPHPVTVLGDGNFVVASPNWYDNRGAVTWGSASTGVSGTVSDANSLVGTSSGDRVGIGSAISSNSILPGVTALSNGNYVVASPSWNEGRGAVTWGSGGTGVRGSISETNSLVGGNAGDEVGVYGLTLLSNGNYLVRSPAWNGARGAVTWASGNTGLSGTVSDDNSLVGSNPGGGATDPNPGDSIGYADIILLSNGNYLIDSFLWNGRRGAVTWGDARTGTSGIVSDANSLIGSDPGDNVGYAGFTPSITALSDGNYVIVSPFWNGNRGAVTWGNGSTGTSGVVSQANSLVGSNPGNGIGSTNPGDLVGQGGVAPLRNANYVVRSPTWNGNRGAATWGDGTKGVSGTVSDANSLIGSSPGDDVGDGIFALSNGNYVVDSSGWNGGRGAVTWGNGSTGASGTISAANSLVGSDPQDEVGYRVVPLSNGNYVVDTPFWNGGIFNGHGAVTWGDGGAGVSGTISDANSLVGSNPGDGVGGKLVIISIRPPRSYIAGTVVPLSSGNYVVESPYWNGGRGAVTFGNGSTGISGPVSDANSLVGSNPNDEVDSGGVTPLSNGNYIVSSNQWNGNRGAATWANGTTGVSGPVSDANSLVGGNPNDQVGSGGVASLSNGNYVVGSSLGGRGAVTWGNGSTGVSGIVSEANSLVGSNSGDNVGSGGIKALSNGDYVVSSANWNGQRGAVKWADGSTGTSGIVSDANSLVGSNPNDQVGYFGVIPLSNGNYVVLSPFLNGNRGAVTWGNGSTGMSGVVSDANSVVGSYPGDGPGFFTTSGDLLGYGSSITPLSNGNYVIVSPRWNQWRGAATWVSGTSGKTLDGLGTITPQNSLIGMAAPVGQSNLINLVENSVAQTFVAVFVVDDRVTAGFTDPNQLTYGLAQNQSLAITPDFLIRTLETGTAVVLQASNDITVNSPITVSAGGNGGALTLEAGRSILLNASITTDNGSLTLIANDQLANGVVDSERDPGDAVIIMVSGTTLNTGSGSLMVQLRDGAGLTNNAGGTITLQTITAGSVAIVNNGPIAGSDVILGSVTTTGPQNYANPNGTTLVTGNLSSSDNPITFNDSVTLNAGLTLRAGSSAINFATGTITAGVGVLTVAAGVDFAGSTTLSLALDGLDPGSYSQLTASGPIALGGSTLNLLLAFDPPVGSSFQILTNTGSAPISGRFNGLDEGAVFTQGGFQFEITYQGGSSGNSVVLVRVA